MQRNEGNSALLNNLNGFSLFQVYGQIMLTFRYGREDEEVMGLKFCNEAVMSLAQLYPLHERAPVEPNTQLQVRKVPKYGFVQLLSILFEKMHKC